MENEEIRDSGLLCFVLILKHFGIPIDKRQMEYFQSGTDQPIDLIKIVQFSNEFKIKAKFHKFDLSKKIDIISPIVAKNNEEEYFIIVKKQEDKYIILFPLTSTKLVISMNELIEFWDGVGLVFSKKGILDQDAIFSFKWFIPTILKFKKELAYVLTAVFIIQLLGILTPIMMQVVIDKVLVHNGISTLTTLTVGILAVYILEYALGLAKNYIFTHTTNRIDVILNFKLFKHLFLLPLKYFENRRVGETVARVREVENIRSFLTGTPLSTFIDLIFIIVYIVILFIYNRNLTLVVLSMIPFFAVLSIVITPLFKKRLDEKFTTGAATQSFLVESITGVQTIKSFAVEPKFINKWGDLQADYVKASYKTAMISGIAGTTGQLIQQIFDLLILYFGAKAVMSGDFSVGQLVAFRMLASRVSGPVLRLVQLWQEYQQAALSVKRIGDIFNSPTENMIHSNQISLPRLEGNIIFDKVRFRYNNDGTEVIKGISFEIKAGTIIGIVGRSGSGKSTISKLIQRLYIPEGGKISIDGLDISLANPSLLRRQIGVVLQENFMFNGTVRENIAIHVPAASIEKVIETAKIAGAHDFIMELPNGYDTIIGEKGLGLSGGQKQRVAIARAILSNPSILIFDEATSALDYESESIIQHNLKDICKNRTVIIIAHRLSTLKDAQKIMVIDRGSLVEFDSHQNLLQNQGLYYHLYNQQSRGDISE